jgi:sugar phosphate isomerase/epimerase
MNIGLTFDEQILNSKNTEDWLDLVTTNGASSLEISPHPGVLSLKDYHSIANKSSILSLDLHFHVPYFADKVGFLFDWNIINRESRLKNYFNLLEWIESIKCDDSFSYLIVHGQAYDTNKINALDTTMRFTDNILNQIIKKNYNIRLLYETLPRAVEQSIGNHWDDLYSICNEFDSDNIKICWDICHDLRNHNFSIDHLKNIDFSKVPYAHLHGFDKSRNLDHVGISYNTELYKETIVKSKEFGFNGLINLEHLIYACGQNYETIISNDLQWAKQFV